MVHTRRGTDLQNGFKPFRLNRFCREICVRTKTRTHTQTHIYIYTAHAYIYIYIILYYIYYIYNIYNIYKVGSILNQSPAYQIPIVKTRERTDTMFRNM